MNEPAPASARRVLALNRDLFFGVRMKNQLAAGGFEVEFVPTAAAFAERLRGDSGAIVAGLIDIGAGPDWTVVASLCGELGAAVPIIAFGPHTDVDGFRAAKGSGVTRVISNGDFHRDTLGVVQRYTKRNTSEQGGQEQKTEQ